MTEQVRLTGDSPQARHSQRPTELELNDSIAFSRYTEAIDRIIHQYLYEQSLTSDSEGKLVHF
jgi:hypothetical protein